MNPSPAIVTDVPVEPAMTEDGVIAVMAGMGFEVGVGLGGAVIPPPQPVMAHMQDKTGRESRHAARFINNSRVRNELNLTPQVLTETIISICDKYASIGMARNFRTERHPSRRALRARLGRSCRSSQAEENEQNNFGGGLTK